MKISILIPTYNRPHLLAECLESCAKQTYAASEVLIGDDSSNPESEILIRSLGVKSNFHYVKNTPALGQADNIDSLIRKANGDLLCLIHDDDKLELNALEKLSQIFMTDPEVAISFGKQYIISNEGNVNENASVHLNDAYSRIADKAGKQPDIVKSAILQQVPNNGFLVKAGYAKEIGYSKAGKKYGDACDLGFALELALAYPNMKAFFINEYTAYYRLSSTSISRSKSINNAAYKEFLNLYSLADTKYKYDSEVTRHLEEKAPAAIANAIQLNELKDAKKWLFSRYHKRKLISPGGVRRMLSLAIGTIKTNLTRRCSQLR